MKISNFKFQILNSRRAGFTLVEIMIALAIAGGVIITILYTVNYHADIAYDNTVATRMLFFAKEKIVEMEKHPQNAKGNIPDTDFTYENSVNHTEDDGIIEIKTIVSKKNKKVVLSELILNKEPQQ